MQCELYGVYTPWYLTDRWEKAEGDLCSKATFASAFQKYSEGAEITNSDVLYTLKSLGDGAMCIQQKGKKWEKKKKNKKTTKGFSFSISLNITQEVFKK